MAWLFAGWLGVSRKIAYDFPYGIAASAFHFRLNVNIAPMDERYWYLKRCDLFAHLNEAGIARLEQVSHIRTFERRSLIYLPNEASDSVLLLVSGRVRIYHLTGEGKEALLAFIDPGELFGELTLVGQQEREEFAETLERSQVLKIPRQQLLELMQEQPEMTLRLTRLIGLRRQVFERRLKSLLFQSNRERLSHLLLELAERYGVADADGTALRIKFSHQELANLIGSTRETVTVILQELQREKLVLVRRRQLILRNPQALSQGALGAGFPGNGQAPE